MLHARIQQSWRHFVPILHNAMAILDKQLSAGCRTWLLSVWAEYLIPREIIENCDKYIKNINEITFKCQLLQLVLVLIF